MLQYFFGGRLVDFELVGGRPRPPVLDADDIRRFAIHPIEVKIDENRSSPMHSAKAVVSLVVFLRACRPCALGRMYQSREVAKIEPTVCQLPIASYRTLNGFGECSQRRRNILEVGSLLYDTKLEVKGPLLYIIQECHSHSMTLWCPPSPSLPLPSGTPAPDFVATPSITNLQLHPWLNPGTWQSALPFPRRFRESHGSHHLAHCSLCHR